LCYHMPLYYVISGYLQQVVHAVSGAPLHFEFPPNNPDWGTSLAMFEHGTGTPFSGITEPVTMGALRLLSILLGLATVWAAAHLARRIQPDHPLAPVVAATLIAGWPQFLFISRAINNDVLATALAGVLLIVLCEVGRPRRYVWASLLACLIILSKLTMLFAAVVVALAYALEFTAARERRREYILPGLLSLLVFGMLIAFIAWQPTIRYHFSLTQTVFNRMRPDALALPYWLNVLQLTLSSSWVRFGWMNVAVPDWQAYAWWAFIGLTSILGIRAALAYPRNRSRTIILLIVSVWAIGILASYTRINLNRFQPQFRFAFSLLPLLAAFASAGYLKIAGPSTHRQHVAAILLAITLAVANLWIIVTVVRPAYA